jgi:hypothetical protein
MVSDFVGLALKFGKELKTITSDPALGLCVKTKKYKSFSVLYSKDKAIEQKNKL